MTDELSGQLSGVQIVLVSTVPYFMVSQLSAQINYLRSLGMRVTLITSPGEGIELLPSGAGITVIPIDIPRKLQPWRDMKALFKLLVVLQCGSYSILHSTTPKAGLLCAIAGFLTRVPFRLHTFTGQAWLTRTGLMRAIMRWSDKVIVKLSTRCYADSPSQRDFLIDECIADPKHIFVYGKGSLAGVDLQRFSIDMYTHEEKRQTKMTFHIDNKSFIITYIGRITKDKGVLELLMAVEMLRSSVNHVELLLIGPVDGDGQEIINMAEQIPCVHYLGYQSKPEQFLAITDVFCLPSYREGFGTVVIEAAAMGVPCVGSNISGLVDAIEDGETGLLVSPGDERELYSALKLLFQDRKLLFKLAVQAKGRCGRYFSSALVNEMVANEYIKCMDESV